MQLRRALLLPILTLATFTVVAKDSPRSGLPLAKPQSVGLDSKKIGRLRSHMEKLVGENAAAGVVTLVARDGKVVQFEAVGYADREAKKPMGTDTIFRIYSMSKPIVSVAVMMLVEEKKIGLDDPVSKHIPEFAKLKVLEKGEEVEPHRPMTVRDLLRHTAGLTYGFFSFTAVDGKYRAANVLDKESTLETMVGKLSGIPLLYHPGERWHYSVSVDVLGRLVEVVSGKRFDRFLEERIFRVLGMVDTGFHVPPGKIGRFAACYGPSVEAGLKVVDHPSRTRYARPAKFYSGGGGLVSTAHDYVRFAQMMLNGGELDGKRLLRPETVADMTRSHIDEKLLPLKISSPMANTGFGLGVSVQIGVGEKESGARLGEYGWSGAASTNFWVCPREGIISISLTQQMPFSGTVANAFRPLVYDAIVESRATANR
jgi:CubicO group peptidase (beta-lactamase class C family)